VPAEWSFETEVISAVNVESGVAVGVAAETMSSPAQTDEVSTRRRK